MQSDPLIHCRAVAHDVPVRYCEFDDQRKSGSCLYPLQAGHLACQLLVHGLLRCWLLTALSLAYSASLAAFLCHLPGQVASCLSMPGLLDSAQGVVSNSLSQALLRCIHHLPGHLVGHLLACTLLVCQQLKALSVPAAGAASLLATQSIAVQAAPGRVWHNMALSCPAYSIAAASMYPCWLHTVLSPARPCREPCLHARPA